MWIVYDFSQGCSIVWEALVPVDLLINLPTTYLSSACPPYDKLVKELGDYAISDTRHLLDNSISSSQWEALSCSIPDNSGLENSLDEVTAGFGL